MGWAVVDLATSNRNLEGDKILSWYDISRTMTKQWTGTARAQEPHLQPPSLFGTEQTAQLHEFHLPPCLNSMAATA